MNELLNTFSESRHRFICGKISHHILMGETTWHYIDQRIFVNEEYAFSYDPELEAIDLINAFRSSRA